MLLTENIVLRVREWRDRQSEGPDLVPRLRRLWKEPPARPRPEPSTGRASRTLRHGPALQARPSA